MSTTKDTIDYGGAVVWWSLARWTDLADLKRRLSQVGYGNLAPEPRKPAAILREALSQVFRDCNHEVQALKGNGFEVVEVLRGESENIYQRQCCVKMAGWRAKGVPSLDVDPISLKQAIEDEYDIRAGLVPAAGVSAVLVRALFLFSGVRLRDDGSVYWLPGDALQLWDQVATAVAGVRVAGSRSENKLFMIRHEMDERAIEAVADSVRTELLAEAKRLSGEILHAEDNEEPLGGRALLTRKSKAERLAAKLRQYEKILSRTMQDVAEAIDSAEDAVMAATLSVGGDTA
jgi:hypothetical protein